MLPNQPIKTNEEITMTNPTPRGKEGMRVELSIISNTEYAAHMVTAKGDTIMIHWKKYRSKWVAIFRMVQS